MAHIALQVRPEGATDTPYGSHQVGGKRPLEQENDELGTAALSRPSLPFCTTAAMRSQSQSLQLLAMVRQAFAAVVNMLGSREAEAAQSCSLQHLAMAR